MANQTTPPPSSNSTRSEQWLFAGAVLAMLVLGVLLFAALRIVSGVFQQARNGALEALLIQSAAIGVIAMASIQAVRTIVPIRSWFHRERVSVWLGRAPDELKEPADFKLRMTERITRVPYLSAYIRPDTTQELILHNLLQLTTAEGGDRVTVSRAFFDLPLEQLCGQIFVAHSLGCRVALEAIRFLTSVTASGRASMAGACLMAAAVPTYMVDSSPGRPVGELCSAARAIVRSFVLHSTNDFVLRTAFRIGQTSIGEGFLPVAVGFNGGPDTPWSGRGNTGLGHSGYRKHPAAAPATLRAIGHGGTDVLRELQSHPGVTWTLSTDGPPPDRRLTERRWRRVGRHSMLA